MTPAPERPANGDEGACAGVNQAHPQQARDEGGLLPEDFAVIERCAHNLPKLYRRGQHAGYYQHSDVSDLIDIIGRLRAPLHNEAEQGLREKVAWTDADLDKAAFKRWEGGANKHANLRQAFRFGAYWAISQHPVRGKP